MTPFIGECISGRERVHPSKAGATLAPKRTRKQRSLKAIESLSHWYSYSLDYTQMSTHIPAFAVIFSIFASFCISKIRHQQPLRCWYLIWQIQNDAKILKYDWTPGKWVLIREYSARAIQWIPTWQGWDVCQ